MHKKPRPLLRLTVATKASAQYLIHYSKLNAVLTALLNEKLERGEGCPLHATQAQRSSTGIDLPLLDTGWSAPRPGRSIPGKIIIYTHTHTHTYIV